MVFDPKQYLHLYLDGELSKSDQRTFEAALKQDKELAEELNAMARVKQDIQRYYKSIPAPPKSSVSVSRTGSFKSTVYAASLFLAVIVGFWGGHSMTDSSAYTSQQQTAAASQQTKSGKNVVLHLDTNQEERGERLLQEARLLLEQSSLSPELGPKTLEIITNDLGIEFFAENNPHKEEILALLSRYDNVKLIACSRAIERKQEQGKAVKLIPAVASDRLALDIIVEKMQQGWGYKKF
ncbi:hypothetical protein [Thiomicrorhabdus indica]|uniref:hypothetical protein n=1 Tax=Thiomicrorhabdus indica TaxID=2267253 RepID=UPI00102DD5FA|nr:hypothetical protein [Thiomicrorhabdus indica]